MRRFGKVDNNHAEIVKAARKLGFQVLSLAPLGQGCPDLLLYHARTRRLLLVEVKTPSGKVNALQADFAARWPVSVVRGAEDLLTLLLALKA